MASRSRQASIIAVIAVLAVVVLLSVASCGGGATVTIKDLTLDPQTVTIKAGQSVTWTNEDHRTHQIMSGAPPVMTDDFMSPVLQKGDSWSYTFDQPGEYAYHSMTGSLLGWVKVE